MKNSSFILFLIIFLSFSSYGSSTVNWANTPWNYDDRYVRVSLDSGDIEISNVHLDRFAWFGLWTVENISTMMRAMCGKHQEPPACIPWQ